MYSLIVTGDTEAWQGTAYEFPRDRIFEHTVDMLASRLKALGPEEIKEIISNPVLFAFEGTGAALQRAVRIGRINRLQVRHSHVRIEYKFLDGSPLLTNESLKTAKWELDVQDWEFTRTHWAVKDVDLWQALIESKVLTPEQVQQLNPAEAQTPSLSAEIRPSIFKVPPSGVEADLVSVMLPFHLDFDAVFAAIEGACLELGLRCLKASQIWDESEVIQDIFSLIYRSKIVVCDFSGKNPNVFYEAGIAHTLGRFVVPLAQVSEDVPFDIRHHRYLQYSSDPEGLKEMRAALAARLATLKGRQH